MPQMNLLNKGDASSDSFWGEDNTTRRKLKWTVSLWGQPVVAEETRADLTSRALPRPSLQ